MHAKRARGRTRIIALFLFFQLVSLPFLFLAANEAEAAVIRSRVRTALDASGNVHVLFHGRGDESTRARYLKLNKNGEILIDQEELRFPEGSYYPELAVDDGGGAHLFYASRTNGWPGKLAYQKLDGSGSVAFTKEVAWSGAGMPYVTTDDQGRIYLFESGENATYTQINPKDGQALVANEALANEPAGYDFIGEWHGDYRVLAEGCNVTDFNWTRYSGDRIPFQLIEKTNGGYAALRNAFTGIGGSYMADPWGNVNFIYPYEAIHLKYEKFNPDSEEVVQSKIIGPELRETWATGMEVTGEGEIHVLAYSQVIESDSSWLEGTESGLVYMKLDKDGNKLVDTTLLFSEMDEDPVSPELCIGIFGAGLMVFAAVTFFIRKRRETMEAQEDRQSGK